MYTLGRVLAGRHVTGARDHASDVWALERAWHLPNEANLQAHALSRPALVRAAGDYYKFEHWLSLGLVVLFLVWRRPAYYPWFRRVLVLATGLALVCHFAYPLMPPRMRPDLGFVDTGVRFDQTVYGTGYRNHGLLNQYAAMPSMHVAWAVLFALAVVLALRSPWRWVVAGYPVVTVLVVVVTANHYWLDGIVGVALLGVALLVFRSSLPGR